MTTAQDHVGDDDVPEAVARLASALRDAAKLDIEPLAGGVTHHQLQRVSTVIDQIAAARDAGLEALAEDERDGARRAIAAVHARAAAVAIAAGDHKTADGWLTAAERDAGDDAKRAELAAARTDRERFRALVHGRVLFAGGDEREARKLWRGLARGASDPIAAAARAELDAPRPLKGTPSLWLINGFGVRFAGRRDTWSDGSYATTHCVCALWIPIFPLAAYRVFDHDDGHVVVAREPLSALARTLRYVMVSAVVLAIAIAATVGYLTDPDRLARRRFDRAFELAERASPEAAIKALDEVLAGDDLERAGDERVRRAGAEIIELTAGLAPKSPGREAADHANRLVQRFKALPPEAQGTPAREAVVDAIAGWIAQLAGDPGAVEVRLALLERSAEVASARRGAELATEIPKARLAVAAIKAADWPLDALHVLAVQLDAAALAEATRIVARLVDSPSLLVEAGNDLDRWLAATSEGDPVRRKVESQRVPAAAGRQAAEADGVTTAELETMAKQRPWDQYVQLGLARAESDAGKLDAAAARLDRIGPPGMMVREARLLLAQLASARGKLEQADALLTGLLAGRLDRYLVASSALQSATTAANARVERILRSGDVPISLAQDHEAAIGEDAKTEVVRRWATATIDQDAAVIQARQAYLMVADIVPVSLTAGTVKLRRAQAMSGAARDAMLREAERTFLAIRGEAEGQPEYRLVLGEIYAQLGKAEESEREFAAVLALDEPPLSLRVAQTYRSLGSTERATRVARAVFDKPAGRMRSEAAVLLAMLSQHDEAEAERWYRAAESSSPHVRASLLDLEARRLLREGNLAACAARYAEAARLHLSSDSEVDTTGLNNAAIAQLQRFECSGDPAARREAEAMMEKAYRASAGDAIVVHNLAGTLEAHAQLRVLAKRIDIRALRLTDHEARVLIDALLAGPDRDAVRAELLADRGVRRAAELHAQFEVLAPNNVSAYSLRFADAELRGDAAAAAAVVANARAAKGLDVSGAAIQRKQIASGEADRQRLNQWAGVLSRLQPALARGDLDPRTRAAAASLAGDALVGRGLTKRDPAEVARGRALMVEAAARWPALVSWRSVAAALIDEAATAADAKAWSAVRSDRSAVAALDKLRADNPALATAIMGSKPWRGLAGHVRADAGLPRPSDVRLARMLGDAALEQRARPAFDDKLRRLETELGLVLDPGNTAAAEELAYLDRR